jgi:hypothetical protein
MVKAHEILAMRVSTHCRVLHCVSTALLVTFVLILFKTILHSTVHLDFTVVVQTKVLAFRALLEHTALEVAIHQLLVLLVTFHATNSKNVWLVPLDSTVKTPPLIPLSVLKKCTPKKVGSSVDTVLPAIHAFQTVFRELLTLKVQVPVTLATTLSKANAIAPRAPSDTIALVPT